LALTIHDSTETLSSLVEGVEQPIGGWIKRAFDVVAASLAIAVLFPLLLIIAAMICLLDSRPVVIRHERIGRGGKKFGCLKFRSMVVDSDRVLRDHLATNPAALSEWTMTRKLTDDPRITPLGRILRKTSLDELPQLINILAGDMSFVGPRPIVEGEVHHYGPAMREYTRARPGLTGQWQVSGRNDLAYANRVALDKEYVSNWSFKRDIAIILMTIPAVVRARGVY
jgi:exopolysaccharide production protein ExoY